MKLKTPTKQFIEEILSEHDKDGGNINNVPLKKLFDEFISQTDLGEVRLKVAALNKLYSTSIQNIEPVVEKIVEVSENFNPHNVDEYLKFIDDIATTNKWITKKGKEKQITNLSFASKYVHFMSNYKTPIYDSYIWILLKGYLGQMKKEKFTKTKPENYMDFYRKFDMFQEEFKLKSLSIYDIDKFLWKYCRKMLAEIESKNNVDLNKAKSILWEQIKAQ